MGEERLGITPAGGHVHPSLTEGWLFLVETLRLPPLGTL